MFTTAKPTLQDIARLTPRFRRHPRYSGVVAHWLMSEQGGNVSYDISGYNQHMSHSSSGVAHLAGRFGHALDFDGSNGYGQVPDSPLLDLPYDGPFSISFWTNSTSDDGVYIGKVLDSSPFRGYEIYTDALGRLTVTLNSTFPSNRLTVRYTNATGITDWCHICVCYDGSTNASGLTIYQDGDIVTATTTDADTLSGTISSTGDLNIANRDESSFAWYLLDAAMDDIRIYTRQISPAEVVSLYREPFLEFTWAHRLTVAVKGAVSAPATGVASSAGSATTTGTGASTHTGDGSSVGAATTAATGASTHAATASSTGTSTASAVAQSNTGIAASVGAATVSGTGASIHAGDASSIGSGTASAVGLTLIAGVASSVGAATVLGVGAIAGSVGTAAGVAAVSASGISTHAGVATTAGLATVLATGIDASNPPTELAGQISAQSLLTGTIRSLPILSGRIDSP